ncbi:MAG: type II toxin-antitoxin system VapC family toxin [Candidatus Rokubacteria bacterium]|nr:type II toxin-antitoxin system VapC family toxin [Candidatus Rokubacteria bacterium]
MFWDSSALVPTLLSAPQSDILVTALRADATRALWWGSPLECQSALYRRHREVRLPARSLEQALHRLAGLVEDADVVAPTLRLRERAGRLLAAHPLRAGDALQLAAALVWCEDTPVGETFVCVDERLRDAASREGFALLPA